MEFRLVGRRLSKSPLKSQTPRCERHTGATSFPSLCGERSIFEPQHKLTVETARFTPTTPRIAVRRFNVKDRPPTQEERDKYSVRYEDHRKASKDDPTLSSIGKLQHPIRPLPRSRTYYNRLQVIQITSCSEKEIRDWHRILSSDIRSELLPEETDACLVRLPPEPSWFLDLTRHYWPPTSEAYALALDRIIYSQVENEKLHKILGLDTSNLRQMIYFGNFHYWMVERVLMLHGEDAVVRYLYKLQKDRWWSAASPMPRVDLLKATGRMAVEPAIKEMKVWRDDFNDKMDHALFSTGPDERDEFRLGLLRAYLWVYVFQRDEAYKHSHYLNELTIYASRNFGLIFGMSPWYLLNSCWKWSKFNGV
eukprot:GHVN01008391.1.p1 GENE.GHVN01008391.1~~GHVN01008391.1.p1  ORF type:complete len:365 (+),score=34.49 GHVN01008391.1:151-1245(+)